MMAYTFWGLYFLFGCLFLFASGENILCSDPTDKRCKLQTVNIFNPDEQGLCPLNGVINLSNHALTKLINIRNESSFNVTTQYPALNQHAEMVTTPQHRDEVPFINLCGVVYLILSNNSLTVDTMAIILHDQRIRNSSEENFVLKYLDLSYLNISWLPDHIFRQLQFLQVLKLNNNPVGAIENIKNAIIELKIPLQELHLSGCGLKYLPDFFQEFQLTKLNLSNNLFTAVPVLYSISYSLRRLNVDGNPLSVLDDSSFSTYYKIEEISAENCSIYTVIEETFSNNYNLTKLNLKNNNIRYLFPNDIPLYGPSQRISLGNNPWDCTCRNLWLMKESLSIFTKLIEPYNMRCTTPPFYANKRLQEVASKVEKLDNCDSLFYNLLRKSPPLPSLHSHLFDNFISKKAMINLLICFGLFASIAVVVMVVLIRKSNYKSKQQIYKPLYVIEEEDTGYLDEKRIQHI